MDKYEVGFTNCYIQDHPFCPLCKIPIEVAVEWVKRICPEIEMGGCKAKDLQIENSEFGTTNGWLNKRFVIVYNDMNKALALVNWDGKFSVYIHERIIKQCLFT